MDNKTNKGKAKRKRGRTALFDKKRKAHAVYLSIEEYAHVTEVAAQLNMDTGTFIRMVATGYKPIIPDPEFRREMMAIRYDIKNLFKILESLHLTEKKRLEMITSFGFLQRWIKGVKKELDFLDMWIKRL